jgi:hypothetical protein
MSVKKGLKIEELVCEAKLALWRALVSETWYEVGQAYSILKKVEYIMSCENFTSEENKCLD